MSKILDKYNELKCIDNDKLYLFKSGKFYIFVCDDCDKVKEYVVLKKVKFTNDTFKCGFPENSLEDYLKVFNKLGLNVEVVESYELENEDCDKIIKVYNEIKSYLNKIDINSLKPIDAIVMLDDIRKRLNE